MVNFCVKLRRRRLRPVAVTEILRSTFLAIASFDRRQHSRVTSLGIAVAAKEDCVPKTSLQALVLLCYKKPRKQQGHLGRERAKWVAIWRRRVAIEDGLCRSVRTGSAARRVAGLRTGLAKPEVHCP